MRLLILHFLYQNGWKAITHKDGEVIGADDSSVQKRRFTMAYRIERNNLYRYQGKRSDVAVCHDFHAAGDTDGATMWMIVQTNIIE